MSGSANIPAPHNEPVLAYGPGSPERAAVKAELKRLGGEVTEIPSSEHLAANQECLIIATGHPT